jgi:hypothetical protein
VPAPSGSRCADAGGIPIAEGLGSREMRQNKARLPSQSQAATRNNRLGISPNARQCRDSPSVTSAIPTRTSAPSVTDLNSPSKVCFCSRRMRRNANRLSSAPRPR